MKHSLIALILPLLLQACSSNTLPTVHIDGKPDICPDYTDVTVPQSIAPLNFRINGCEKKAVLTLECEGISCTVKGKGSFSIPETEWNKLLKKGKDIVVRLTVKGKSGWQEYDSFSIHVSTDRIDPYLVYRLIEPGYVTWNHLGLYQRRLSDFTQNAIITNDKTEGNCMNCHSFADRNPEKMVFHMRSNYGGTYIIRNGKIEKVDTKTAETISAAVYPQWSVDGRYIAFSVNNIWQLFHSSNPNRAEVFDTASDVVVYDVENHCMLSSPLIKSPGNLETYPSFSNDGRTLYFCTSPIPASMPEGYRDIRYSICSIGFDPQNGSFSDKVDTLYNARLNEGSAVFPRISPDGKRLMFTLSSYGCFPIWHKDSDIWTLDLQNGTAQRIDIINSSDVDSYHSWSSNGKWVVFSSRRMDGLYTRPFIAHVNDDGSFCKPFALPQEDAFFYDDFMKSFNIPEFILDKISMSEERIVAAARSEAIKTTYR